MESLEEKEAQVAAWLKKIFGDHPIPQYEVNPRTTEILHHLAERNRVRDRDVHLVIEDWKQKASEYESEGETFSPRHGCFVVSSVTGSAFRETRGTKTTDYTFEEKIGVLFRFNAESISCSGEN
ncbi:HAUS augmin like complex subunit 1 [Phyllostomus discolor]|uniref:HAUS augmin like complex subunit 1 n=1 Tax=Phyllostomus discolor TaxID=89673 RepID=A0A834DLN3_9CHIR|nr:HAUS augmin like complex subunit 1 [Phyllostomus discolor]